MSKRALFVLSVAIVAGASGAALAAPRWAYSGDGGPERWGGLDRDYAACSSGQQQSPIDLTSAVARDVQNPQLAYQPASGRILNNGHTVEVDLEGLSTLSLDGYVYELQQFHFHSPSEHTVDGSSFPAELHLVHRGAGGVLAVIGVLLQVGAENPALRPLLAAIPGKVGREARLGDVDVQALLPADRRAYRYSGSLTTPPCTENVSWVVMATPISASSSQIAALARVLQGNSRPVQSLGRRELVLDSTP